MQNQNQSQNLKHQKPDGIHDFKVFFHEHNRPKINPIFPFTFCSNIRSPLERWENSIICTTENMIHLDADTNLHPDQTRRFEEIIRHIRSQLAVRKSKHFYHLAIDLSFCEIITGKDFRDLGVIITKYFKSLRSLTIKVEKIYIHQNGHLMTNSDMIWFSNLVTKSLTNLQELNFIIKQNQNLVEQGFKNFCYNFSKRLKKIQSLNLTFHENETQHFSSKLLKVLTHYPTNYLRDLKYFKLHLIGLSSRKNPLNFSKLAFNRSRFLKHLEHLELSLHSTEYSPSSIEKGILSHSEKSRKLILHIDNSQTNPDNFSSITSYLFQHSKSLKRCSFSIKEGHITPGLFDGVMKGISLCTHTLEEIKFHFAVWWIDLAQVFHEFKCIPNNNIKILDLHFFVSR